MADDKLQDEQQDTDEFQMVPSYCAATRPENSKGNVAHEHDNGHHSVSMDNVDKHASTMASNGHNVSTTISLSQMSMSKSTQKQKRRMSVQGDKVRAEVAQIAHVIHGESLSFCIIA